MFKINFTKERLFYITIIILLLAAVISLFFRERDAKIELEKDFSSYLKLIYNIERGFIENIPTYDDYVTHDKKNYLRKYLLYDHIEAAKKYGVDPVKDENEIPELVKSGKLKCLKFCKDRLFYFYNVRDKYKYVTPGTAKGLSIITERFNKNIKKRKDLPPVKIAISSMLRPEKYQKSLRAKNRNASVMSTHSCGTSFDIFYDDYFVVLPSPPPGTSIPENVQALLKNRFGFILGDSLRRQFKSVLMETLIQLQDEGILYAIFEHRQKCYHVTVLKI